MTAPFDDFADAPPLILRRVDGEWALYDTDTRQTLSSHRTLLLAEAAQIAEPWRRSEDET